MDGSGTHKHTPIHFSHATTRGGFSMVAGVARATPQLYLRSVIFFPVSCFFCMGYP
ncbi:hypothetical protein Hanom_Chr05g00448031 [Helianthus anomalus]